MNRVSISWCAVLVACVLLFGCTQGRIMGKSPEELFSEPKDAALLEAVLAQDAEQAKSLIATGANPNAVGLDGGSMLGWLLTAKNPQALRVLLEVGADPKQRAWDRYNAYQLAAGGEDLRLLPVLLEFEGGDPNQVAEDGQTLLTFAARYERWETLKYLLDRGANPNLADGGSSPLFLAISRGQSDIVVLLLERGMTSELKENAASLESSQHPDDSAACLHRKRAFELFRKAGVELPTREWLDDELTATGGRIDGCVPAFYLEALEKHRQAAR